MLDTEYNEAEVKEMFVEEGRAMRDDEQIRSLLNRGKTVDEIVDFCGYPYEQVKKVEDSMLVLAGKK